MVVSAFELAAENDLDNLDNVLANTDGDIETRLRAVLYEYGPTGRAVGWRLWIETWSACLRQPALRDVTHRLDLRWREVVADLIRAGVAAGDFRTRIRRVRPGGDRPTRRARGPARRARRRSLEEGCGRVDGSGRPLRAGDLIRTATARPSRSVGHRD